MADPTACLHGHMIQSLQHPAPPPNPHRPAPPTGTCKLDKFWKEVNYEFIAAQIALRNQPMNQIWMKINGCGSIWIHQAFGISDSRLCTAWNATGTSGFGDVKKRKFRLQMLQCISGQCRKISILPGFQCAEPQQINIFMSDVVIVTKCSHTCAFGFFLQPIYYSFNSKRLMYISDMQTVCHGDRVTTAWLHVNDLLRGASKEACELCLFMRWCIFTYISLGC